ncbi:MAG: hypothetical protein ACI4HM_01120, partial [Ruminococcus sp.]
MKKLISLLLTVVTLLSTLAVMPSAGAVTKTSAKTTYIPSRSIYSNKYGMVYINGRALVAKNTKGKKVTLFETNTSYAPSLRFYMRGKKVIYYNTNTEELYSVQIDGKNKKKIGDNVESFLGGYGEDVIAHKNGKYIYKISPNGKKTNLFSSKRDVSRMFIFGGKVYVNYWKEYSNLYTPRKFNIYDLKTKKISSIGMVKPDYIKHSVGKNSMYYINSKKNLVKMDLQGRKTTIATNVSDINAVNDGDTVVYSKSITNNGKQEDVMLYSKKTGKKTVELCKKSDIKKKAKSVVGNWLKNEHYYNEYVGQCKYFPNVNGAIGKNNIYFGVYYYDD